MNIFVQSVNDIPAIAELKDELNKNGEKTLSLSGVPDSAKAHMIFGVGDSARFKLVICEDEKKAKDRLEEYSLFDRETVYFPSKDILFYESDLRSNELSKERINTIERLISGERLTVFTTPEALMNRIPSKERFSSSFLNIKIGDEIDLEDLRTFFIRLGYEMTGTVEGPGEFSIRGGIVDIFPMTEDMPFRIEFFGDEVDSIRSFDVESQKSIEKEESVKISPSSEFLPDSDDETDGMKRLTSDAKNIIDGLYAAHRNEEAFRLKSKLENLTELAERHIFGQEFEAYSNYFIKDTVSILSYFIEDNKNSLIFFDEPSHILNSLKYLGDEWTESMAHRLENGDALPLQKDMLFTEKDILSDFAKCRGVTLSMLDYTNGKLKAEKRFSISTSQIISFHGNFELLLKELIKYKKLKRKIIIVSPSRTRGERLAREISDRDIPAYFTEDLDRKIIEGEIIVTAGFLREGVEYLDSGFVFISESDIFGTARKKKKIKRYSGDKIRSLRDISPGDYVVHENYGVGIYRGLQKIEMDGVSKDYIKLSYDKGENLYIPATQFDLIGKYSGADGKKPKLNSLTNGEWKKTVGKVKSAVSLVAKDLVELYAKRQQETGFVYSPDNDIQREFEESFPYEETESQLNAIEDVKRDMESPKIMDRLICGDVGFGKTEIALRAAFKAVLDGKQVVYLVPTTILAEQHYNTFKSRMANYPVNIEMMSRFRSSSENKKTAEKLKTGAVDIVIGTHRLLSKDVSFKNLGLLIIDEEQRFGVSHKEKIKKLKENVDVLSLSATPIPRTLNMSMIGIRDMSLLEEAPQERMPIQTFVFERNPELIREAINRELSRGGQVYYVTNVVRTIADVAAEIQALVPDAVVAYAHGQMPEGRLEEIMSDFINREIDVLVATTIIEIGLDISNVNTIIIHDADKLGLSQLYQLRGRVGRSNRTAYAYLMYKKDKVLKEVAEKRLSAIREFTELGSGFKIAMRDLEIRGAGTLLGEAQSGHMEAVGYDMYVKLLSEALKHESGEEIAPDFNTEIDLDIDAFLPPQYIEDEDQKLDIYKRISEIASEKELSDMTDELIDRFGDPPKSVMNLLGVSLLRSRAHEVYITEIKQKGKKYKISLYPEGKLDASKIPEVLSDFSPYLSFSAEKNAPYFEFDCSKNNRMSDKEISQVPNVMVKEIKKKLII